MSPTGRKMPETGLLLTGGGARAAYQVGVLEAIADIRNACAAHREHNPFPIITGTSAGAINAAALACGADDFDAAVRRMARVWRNFHAGQVLGAQQVLTVSEVNLRSVGNQFVRHAARLRALATIGGASAQHFAGEALSGIGHTQGTVNKDFQRKRISVQGRRFGAAGSVRGRITDYWKLFAVLFTLNFLNLRN